MIEEIDIHHSKKRYTDFVELINKLPHSEGKDALTKYIEWHNTQLQKNKMSYSSCKRSLEIALRLIDSFPKLTDLTQNKLEKWFEQETKRNKLHRTGGDSIKQCSEQISLGTIQKTQSQLLKFIKFIDFLKLNKPITLFNSKRIPVPLIAQFCFADTTSRKNYEPPLVSQEQIKEVIDYLLSTGNYVDEVTGVLVSYLNDTGNRLSEAVSLRHENISMEKGYWLVRPPESKTTTRTNVILLSKEYMNKWLAKCPTKGNKKGLVFCNKQGEKVAYSPMRESFMSALKKKGIEWKKNSSFHYLRHLAASRLYEMPQNLAEYYFGWEGSGMRATYSNYSWEACLPHLLKSIKGNPMADTKLSYMDEGEQDFSKRLEDELYERLMVKIKNTNK